MKLWPEAGFLFALLLVSSLALPPGCEEPLSLDDHSTLYGMKYLVRGYVDHDDFRTLLKFFDSYWMNITASPAGAGQVLMTQEMKINGTCARGAFNMTIEGNTASLKLPGFSAEYKVWPSCAGCLIISVNNTVEKMEKLLEEFKIEGATHHGEVNSLGLYLMANGTTVKDSDEEHFKKVAHCLGFPGEPHFHYNETKGVC